MQPYSTPSMLSDRCFGSGGWQSPLSSILISPYTELVLGGNPQKLPAIRTQHFSRTKIFSIPIKYTIQVVALN
jgi:hypothetical protein